MPFSDISKFTTCQLPVTLQFQTKLSFICYSFPEPELFRNQILFLNSTYFVIFT